MKKLDFIQAESLRTLIRTLNEIGVQEEDLICIQSGKEYTAIFYVEQKQ